MRNKYFLAYMIMTAFFLGSCTSSNTHVEDFYSTESVITCHSLEVNKDYTEFMKDVSFVPLETTDESIIGYITQIEFTDSFIFVNADRKKILQFDRDGNFIQRIGSLGKGPMEYLEARDICVIDTSIYILDYRKILCYSFSGRFLYSKGFNLSSGKRYCNATHFYPAHSDGFYLWGGTVGIDKKNAKYNHLMYYVNESMEIEKSYFPVTNPYGGRNDVFNKSLDGGITIDPAWGTYDVYQMDSIGNTSIKYHFDFGKHTHHLDSFEDIENKRPQLKEYILQLKNFAETPQWIHISFDYKSIYYDLFYHKNSKRTYITSAQLDCRSMNDYTFWNQCYALDNQFVSVIQASWFLNENERLGEHGKQRYRLNKYQHVKEDDNPILVFYQMKDIS